MCIFLLVYALILLALFPLLNQETPNYVTLKRGQVLQPVFRRAVDGVKHLPHAPGQLVVEGVASVLKKKLDSMRHREGLTDARLLDKASEELQLLRKRNNKNGETDKLKIPNKVVAGKRTGFMVLGMHRSGTSMLSGLMATGMGYKTGGPLIGGAFDNVKGFYERLDFVYQNDEFMNKQETYWSVNVIKYDSDKALEMKKSGQVDFLNGEKALKFVSDPNNSPWLQKDPRQCITLKTWLPLLPSEPAIVFTYRHPLEVASSLKNREKDFPLERGLRLWIVYNRRAIENSRGLCIVYSSNEAILAKPKDEIQRISNELTSKCGVPKPPDELSQQDVDRFIDPSLQHNKEDKNDGKEILDHHGDCNVYAYKSDATGEELVRERDLYIKAMKVYCDYKSGIAYEEKYEWPILI
jgi:hypothetical protein